MISPAVRCGICADAVMIILFFILSVQECAYCFVPAVILYKYIILDFDFIDPGGV